MHRRSAGTAFLTLTLLAALSVLAPAPARAQPAPQAQPQSEDADGGLSVSGSIRIRYEALAGQSRAGLGAGDALFNIRTILLTEYRRAGVRLGAEIHDGRAYGSRPGSAIGTTEVNTIEPVQAYVGLDLREPFGSETATALLAGRFTLNVGSRRLVAADDYRNTTNGYTGARVDVRTRGGTALTLFYTLPQTRRPGDRPSILDNEVGLDRESFDQQLWGGFASTPRLVGAALGEIGYVRFQERDGGGLATRDRHLQSVSARIIRQPAAGTIDYEAEAIYQFGSIRASVAPDAPPLDVSAWFLHLDAGYTFPGSPRARLSLEYDRASGDGQGGAHGRFDTLFGMRRADLAPSGIYAQIGRANISTPGVRVEAAPARRLDGFITYRAMWLADATDAFSTTGVRDASGASGRFAGHQVEGRIRAWAIVDRLRAEVNAAWLRKGRFLRQAPNAPDTDDTRYVSFALTSLL